MGLGGVMLALSAVQAVSQIGSGYVQKAESEVNAKILEGKAGMIDIQKGIEKEQYQRFAGRTLSTSYANIGASGLMASGSFINVMIDVQKQIFTDQAIGQFNLEQQKRFTMAEADQQRRAGKLAVREGYSNAFSTMLSAASNYAMYKGYNSTFDSVKTVGNASNRTIMKYSS